MASFILHVAGAFMQANQFRLKEKSTRKTCQKGDVSNVFQSPIEFGRVVGKTSEIMANDIGWQLAYAAGSWLDRISGSGVFWEFLVRLSGSDPHHW